MKKRLFSTLIALFSINILLAQIVVFTPVKVEKEDVDQFLNVEITFVEKFLTGHLFQKLGFYDLVNQEY